MRRYTFYLSVALLAFGIGSFVVFKFYWRDETVISKIDETVKTSTINVLKQQPLQENKGRIPKYSCNDGDVLNLRGQLETDEFLARFENDKYLQSKNLSEIDCSEIYEIKRIDLDNDNIEEIIIKGNSVDVCSVRGNCNFWVFLKTENNYRMILHDEWTFDYKIQPAKTKSYKDLRIEMNSSNGNPVSYVNVFKFNGRNYQKKECFSEEWVGKTGKTELLRFNCKEYGE
jgi:hypothetical protein